MKTIEHICRNKRRVEWIEPNPGLVDYVESGQLAALWKDARRLLEEEKNAERLRRHNQEQGYSKGSPKTRLRRSRTSTVVANCTWPSTKPWARF